MFSYYVQLAVRSFRRRIVLTILMTLSIGLGIGATITTTGLLRLLSRDPVPENSSRLYIPTLDPRGFTPDTVAGTRPTQLTLIDASALWAANKSSRQVMMTGGRVVLSTPDGALRPLSADARYTTAGFFSLFHAPLRFGGGWGAEDDGSASRVAVISSELNDRAFGGQNSVGRVIHVGDADFRIVGVLGDWQVSPHFYDLSSGAYAAKEMIFVPFSTAQSAKLRFQGNPECWGSGIEAMAQADWLATLWGGRADCAWIQYWVELRDAQQRDAYHRLLEAYASEQVRSGRFPRQESVGLFGLMEWLDVQNVVPRAVRLQVAIALSFLLVCLVNTVSLMLTKFLATSQSVGVRRALGATARAIFAQYLVEAAIVGIAGGILGAAFSVAGLALVRLQPLEYAAQVHVDVSLLVASMVLSVAAATAAGLVPAWLVCRVSPSRALRIA